MYNYIITQYSERSSFIQLLAHLTSTIEKLCHLSICENNYYVLSNLPLSNRLSFSQIYQWASQESPSRSYHLEECGSEKSPQADCCLHPAAVWIKQSELFGGGWTGVDGEWSVVDSGERWWMIVAIREIWQISAHASMQSGTRSNILKACYFFKTRELFICRTVTQ